jgi:hypothetical protein
LYCDCNVGTTASGPTERRTEGAKRRPYGKGNPQSADYILQQLLDKAECVIVLPAVFPRVEAKRSIFLRNDQMLLSVSAAGKICIFLPGCFQREFVIRPNKLSRNGNTG